MINVKYLHLGTLIKFKEPTISFKDEYDWHQLNTDLPCGKLRIDHENNSILLHLEKDSVCMLLNVLCKTYSAVITKNDLYTYHTDYPEQRIIELALYVLNDKHRLLIPIKTMELKKFNILPNDIKEAFYRTNKFKIFK